MVLWVDVVVATVTVLAENVVVVLGGAVVGGLTLNPGGKKAAGLSLGIFDNNSLTEEGLLVVDFSAGTNESGKRTCETIPSLLVVEKMAVSGCPVGTGSSVLIVAGAAVEVAFWNRLSLSLSLSAFFFFSSADELVVTLMESFVVVSG